MELAADQRIGNVHIHRSVGAEGGSRNPHLTGQLGDTQKTREEPHKTWDGTRMALYS